MPAPAPAPVGEQPSLMPDEMPQGLVPPVVRRDKKTKTEEVEEEYVRRVRFRQAQTRAVADPAVQAEWEIAKVAKTDYEKREAMKRYYKLLFARVRKLDGTVKEEADRREAAAISRLEQHRVAATEEPVEREGNVRGVVSPEAF